MLKRALLTFINYRNRMNRMRANQRRVTLMLQDEIGKPWVLSLSEDCARFIGRYRRVPGFASGPGLLEFADSE